MKKSTFLLSILSCLSVASLAQKKSSKIFIGLESGIGLLNPEVNQLAGTGFVQKPQPNLGHTGITVGLKFLPKTEIEFGRYVFNLYQNQAYFEGEGYGWSSRTWLSASSYSTKIKQTILKNKKTEIGVFGGFSTVLLDMPEWYQSTPFRIESSGSSFDGTIRTYDTTFSSMTFVTNKIVPLQYGIHAQYKINPRISIAANLTHQVNRNAYALENVLYKRDREPDSQAIISHTGSGFYLTLGLIYYWRDLTKIDL